MKALALTQPWASLVALGAKRIETRSWRTDYRGPLAIYAAKGLNGIFPGAKLDDLRVLCDEPMFFGALWPDGSDDGLRHPADGLPRGAIIAVCDLVDIVETGRANFAMRVVGLDRPGEVARETAFGNFALGRWAWLLENARAVFAELPKGAVRDFRGVFEIPDDVLARASHSHPVSTTTAVDSEGEA